jgi:hypothetical protein
MFCHWTHSDAKLKAVLGVDVVTWFSIQKYLSPHFLGKDENRYLTRSGLSCALDSLLH